MMRHDSYTQTSLFDKNKLIIPFHDDVWILVLKCSLHHHENKQYQSVKHPFSLVEEIFNGEADVC
jgi:hypothetical protein